MEKSKLEYRLGGEQTLALVNPLRLENDERACREMSIHFLRVDETRCAWKRLWHSDNVNEKHCIGIGVEEWWCSEEENDISIQRSCYLSSGHPGISFSSYLKLVMCGWVKILSAFFPSLVVVPFFSSSLIFLFVDIFGVCLNSVLFVFVIWLS